MAIVPGNGKGNKKRLKAAPRKAADGGGLARSVAAKVAARAEKYTIREGGEKRQSSPTWKGETGPAGTKRLSIV